MFLLNLFLPILWATKYPNSVVIKFDEFDTVLSINVIDHVWDAYQFLGNIYIYKALKPGGIWHFHDRFSPNPDYLDKAPGPGNHFFEQFEEIYMFVGQTTEMIRTKSG